VPSALEGRVYREGLREAEAHTREYSLVYIFVLNSNCFKGFFAGYNEHDIVPERL
jgi:hypothetical protein